jgi:hypothetical protein
MTTKRRLVLLLGAGFSLDAGLPLTSGLTKRFVAISTNAESVRHFRKKLPSEFMNDFLKLSSSPNVNYEDILGWLQLSQARFEHRAHLQEIHGLRLWLTDVVYKLLLADQITSHKNRSTWISKYSGLKKLTDVHLPLRIFSLNHDLVIEDICEALGIDVQSGFGGDREKINLTKEGEKSSLPFSIFPREELRRGKLNLLSEGSPGVNLYKVHGGLDFFSFKDESQFVRILTGSVTGDLDGLIRLTKPVPIGNVFGENIVYDSAKEMQFLRRVHVAGTYKFDPTKPQNLPEEWLKRFRADINSAEDLAVIGYGFGDAHINLTIRGWLEHHTLRKLHIVNPYISEIPSGFRHFYDQVVVRQITVADYLK